MPTLQAEYELLCAENVKWEEDAKSLTSTRDVSTLNLRFICMSVMRFTNMATVCQILQVQ